LKGRLEWIGHCFSLPGGFRLGIRNAIFLLGILALACTGQALAQGKIRLTIESWRNDDLKIWRDPLIPAFAKKNPDIEIVLAPTAPAEYNAVLDAKLKAGTAGDLLACRPFDKSLAIYNAGELVPLNDLPGMANFSEVAKAAWSPDESKAGDGRIQTVPVRR
jgi:raffinose/stachyose/melibiose transport system substrate-binding protein